MGGWVTVAVPSRRIRVVSSMPVYESCLVMSSSSKTPERFSWLGLMQRMKWGSDCLSTAIRLASDSLNACTRESSIGHTIRLQAKHS